MYWQQSGDTIRNKTQWQRYDILRDTAKLTDIFSHLDLGNLKYLFIRVLTAHLQEDKWSNTRKHTFSFSTVFFPLIVVFFNLQTKRQSSLHLPEFTCVNFWEVIAKTSRQYRLTIVFHVSSQTTTNPWSCLRGRVRPCVT